MSKQEYGALAAPARGFIVLVALLQGLALYFVGHGPRHIWWWLADAGPQVYWYSLVLAVPTMLTLSVQRLDDRRLWLQALGVAIVYALLASWAAWSITGAPGINLQPVLLPFAVTAAGALFVALPFLQCQLEHGRWRAPYAELFDHAWQNGLTLVVAGLFTAVCWLVLTLWAELFALVHIRFFRELFEGKPFVYLATGLFAGLGILIGRTQHHPLRVARQIVFAVCRGLLPLLALIALMFLASLPFTGLAPLWATRSAAGLLLGLLLLLVTFVNAVWQDGIGVRPYPRVLRWLIDAALVLAPLFALLAGYALALRIRQYGWTADRFWAALVALVLACHAFGYAFAALRRREGWLAWLPRVNVALAALVVVLVVLTNSPALDPYRTTVASQLARLHAGKVTPDKFDVATLRFDSGRRGYRAAVALQEDPAMRSDPAALAYLQRAIRRTSESAAFPGSPAARRLALKTPAALRTQVALAPGAQDPGDEWYQWLLADTGEACRLRGADCVLLTPDLRGDGRREALLCDLGLRSLVTCRLSSRDTRGHWQRAGTFTLAGRGIDGTRAIQRALRQGKLEVTWPQWPDVEVAGTRARITPVPGRRPASAGTASHTDD